VPIRKLLAWEILGKGLSQAPSVLRIEPRMGLASSLQAWEFLLSVAHHVERELTFTPQDPIIILVFSHPLFRGRHTSLTPAIC
jgi:hypothetical protein